VLLNLQHRGACGCETTTGDGAGILLQTPHAFLARECDRIGINLPAAGEYGVGMVFLPADARDREHCQQLFEQIVRDEGPSILAFFVQGAMEGWQSLERTGSFYGDTVKSLVAAARGYRRAANPFLQWINEDMEQGGR